MDNIWKKEKYSLAKKMMNKGEKWTKIVEKTNLSLNELKKIQHEQI